MLFAGFRLVCVILVIYVIWYDSLDLRLWVGMLMCLWLIIVEFFAFLCFFKYYYVCWVIANCWFCLILFRLH